MRTKKLYLVLGIVCMSLLSEKLQAQCAVSIGVFGPTSISCNNDRVTLKAEATGAGTLSYQWSHGPTAETIMVSRAGTYTVTVSDTAGCSATGSVTITGDRTPPAITLVAFPGTLCKGDSVTLIAFGADSYNWQPGDKSGSVIRVAPDATTTYTVSGVGTNYCLSTKSIEVVVRPLPTATITGTRTVCQNSAPPRISFTGSGSTTPYTFAYRVNGGAVQSITTSGTSNTATVEAPTGVLGTSTYELLSVSAGGGCTQGQSGTAVITVLSGPALTSQKDTSVCSSTPFNYRAASTVPNTSFTWSRAVINGISNAADNGSSNIITETLLNTTDRPIAVYYVFRLSTASAACETVDSIRVVVNPTPRINVIRDTSFCNGSFVVNGIPFNSPTPNATFSWTNSNPSIGLPASGSGNLPAFVATNELTTEKTAVITVSVKASADECAGVATRSFVIRVRPGPALTNRRNRSICNNALFADTARSTAQGTTFLWSRRFVQGISNPAVVNRKDSVIRETLTNTTDQPVDVFYLLALSTGGADCQTIDSIRVTVNPTPQINAITNQTICNGTFVRDGIAISSPSPNASFEWVVSGADIGLPRSGRGSIPPFIARNLTTTAVEATITVSVKASSDSCASTSSRMFTITILPGPALTSTKDTSVCNNLPFRYTATSSAQITTNFTWARAAAGNNAAVTKTGPVIEETLRNNTGQPLAVYYVFTLSTGVGCITTDSVKVTINPTPAIKPVNDTAFCNSTFVRNGITFESSSPGAAFSWTNSNPAIGLPASGRGHIPPFNALNNGTTAITATITVSVKASSDSCVGAATETFVITVRPGPAFTSTRDTSVCNNTFFRYRATSSVSGTGFSWKRAATRENPESTGTGPLVEEELRNMGDNPIDVIYTFTLTTGTECDSVTYDVKVTINPTPMVNPVGNLTYCNGVFVTAGIPFSSPSPNVAFRWVVVGPGIGLPQNGRGNLPPFNTINSTAAPLTATVNVFAIASADSCAATTAYSFTITVRPGPALTNNKNQSICNNTQFADTASSTAQGTTFFWSRRFVPGITNAAIVDRGGAIISETLSNTTNDPIDVFYVIRLFTGGDDCETVDSIRVTVYPTPKIVAITDREFCNDTLIQPIPVRSLTSIATLRWASDRAVGFGSDGTGDIPAFNTSNQTDSAITANLKVTSSVGDGCRGDSAFFAITVYPTAVLTSVRDTTVCDTIPFVYTARSSAKGTSFSWTRAMVAGISNGAGSGGGAAISERLDNNTTQPVDVVYVFQLTTGSSCVTVERVNVTVNPTPAINPIQSRSYCNGVPVSGIPFTSTSPNAAFTWTNSNTKIGLPQNGTGSIPVFTATNKSTGLDSATITVFVTASPDNCAGRSDSFKIYVIPSPPRPSFTSLNGRVDSVALEVCGQSENINFNVNIPVSGVSYRWSAITANPAELLIRNTGFPNTVVSFFGEGEHRLQVLATDLASTCQDSVRQLVKVGRQLNTNGKEKIFVMQPGNLLVYPDNSLKTYQWGFDPVNRTLADRDFGKPQTVPGQVNQFFVPDGQAIDTTRFLYWVMLTNNQNCSTRVYYNGPFANRRVQANAGDNTVQLQVVPNPTGGQFRLLLKGNIYGTVDARIYNSLGHVVFRKRFVKTVSEVVEAFDAASLPAGLYFVELQSSDLKKVVSRFVVQH